MKRVRQEFYGRAVAIPPQEPGALAQCSLCTWGVYVVARKRKKWSALDRAFAKLRAHARKEHADKFHKITTADEFARL